MSTMIYDSYEQHLHKPGDPIAPPRTRWIWVIFWYLLIVTGIEVGLASANYYMHLGWENVLNYVYVALTILKAYYIIFSYMHLKDERKNFKLTLSVLIFILCYFIALMMIEGLYMESIRLIIPDYFFQLGGDHGGDAGGHH